MRRAWSVRRRRSSWLVSLTVLSLLSVQLHAQNATASKIKAAFLYNFAKFAEWPAESLAPGQQLHLCVVGDDAVADALEEMIRGRAVEGHELTVRVVGAADPASELPSRCTWMGTMRVGPHG